MIYVDSCIPMYLVGRDHPNKRRVIDLVSKLLNAHEELVTSAEAFQEIIHRYKSINDMKNMEYAYRALEDMAHVVADVKKSDVDESRALAVTYKKISSRDCLHVAIMKRISCDKIWTFDRGFDEVAFLERIE